MPRTGAANMGEWIQAAKKLAKLLEQVDKIAESEAVDSIKYQLVFGMLAGDIRALCQQLDIPFGWYEEDHLEVSAKINKYQGLVAEVVAQTKPILEAFGQQ